MTETQEILGKGIGSKEATALKPKKVKIVGVRIAEVGEKKNKKLVIIVKHPDKTENIEISSVKYEVKGSLKTSGLWINLDEDELLRKGSALALLLEFLGVSAPIELTGKEINTAEDDKGYLMLKAY